VRILQLAILVVIYCATSTSLLLAQSSGNQASVRDQLNDAQGELMRLPPLKDLLKIALQSAPGSKQIDITQQQEREREKLWRLAQLDILTLQGVAIAGRRDVFAVNSDGTVFVPTASVVDNLNTQGSIGLRINPISFLQSRRQVQIAKLEGARLEAEREIMGRGVAEGVIFAYNMAQKSLELMDLRAETMEAVTARADLAERLFRQGAMTLTEYTEFQSKASDMSAKFYDARGDFRLYYHMLMERVYGKIP
jgi:outer membrane protein TolC